MTQVRCRQVECIYWEDGFCTAGEIELDPELGCLTMEGIEDIALDEEDWEDEGEWE